MAAVVVDHLFGYPRGGFVGVDVFFVISGFLITGLLLREQERSGTISWVNFYRRRIKRIIPAATVVLVVTVAASYVVFSGSRADSIRTDAVWSFFFSANWRFLAQSTDYFAQGVPVSPLQHYWSLSVEEQFYFVWPWLMLMVFALVMRSHNRRIARVAVLALIVTVTASSFAFALHASVQDPTGAYFSSLTRAWELGVGAALAVAAPLLFRLPNWSRPALAWLGLVGVIASLWVVTDEAAFPAPGAALPVLATALVIAAGTFRDGSQQQRWMFPLTNRVSNYLGDISYSLYLWHFPIVILGAELLGDSPSDQLILLVSMLAAAAYSYGLLEDPIRHSEWLEPGRRHRRHGRRRPRGGEFSTRYQLGALSLLTLIVAGMAVAALQPPEPPQGLGIVLPSAKDEAADKGGRKNADRRAETPQQDQLESDIVEALNAASYPPLDPTMDEAFSGLQADRDVVECGTTPVLDTSICTWGDPRATKTVVTIGSSLSMTWANVIKHAIGESDGWRVIAAGQFACPFGDPNLLDPQKAVAEGCFDRNDAEVELLNEIEPDLVIVSGLDTAEAAISQWEKVSLPQSTQVLVLPYPGAFANPQDCYGPRTQPSDCVANVLTGGWPPQQEFARFAGGEFVDPSDWFCYERQCPLFVDGIPTKKDGAHMTPEYGARIAPVVAEYLANAGFADLG